MPVNSGMIKNLREFDCVEVHVINRLAQIDELFRPIISDNGNDVLGLFFQIPFSTVGCLLFENQARPGQFDLEPGLQQAAPLGILQQIEGVLCQMASTILNYAAKGDRKLDVKTGR